MTKVAEFCACSVIPEVTTVTELGELMLAANYLDIVTLLRAASVRLGEIGAALMKESASGAESDLFDMSSAATNRAVYRTALKGLYDQEWVNQPRNPVLFCFFLVRKRGDNLSSMDVLGERSGVASDQTSC
jgi:hypothetical protein